MKTNSLDFDARVLKEKILDLAMRGKLVSQDPNDEPASILLKKIKDEKEHLIKEKKIRKTKPLPPISGDEKPFKIPDSWEWVRLGNVSDSIKYGYTASAKDIGNCKFLRITDIQNGKVDWRNVPYCNISNEKVNNLKIKNDDILVARTGGTVGKSFKVNSIPMITVFASYLIRIRLLFKSDYIFYSLNSPLYWDFIKAKKSGTGQPNVNATKLSKLVIPFPPLDEQSRIAAKIAQLFALLHKVESSIQQYAKLQTLLKSKILDLAMRGKLVKQDPKDEPASVLIEKIRLEKDKLIEEKQIKKTKPLPLITDDEKPFDIPDSWKWVRCNNITTIGNFESVAPKDIKKGSNLIELADIESYTGRLIRVEKVKKVVGSNKYKYSKGQVLFGKLRPYLRKVVVAPDNGFCSTELLPISGIIINNLYLFFVFLSTSFFEQITKEMHGVNLPRVSPKKLSELLLPLPPLKEQERIAERIVTLNHYLFEEGQN